MTTARRSPPAAAASEPQRATRMPRPARRRQLLAAAQEVFVAQGYHAAAMDDIAERAGVSKPVLYQHFPSKLELYLALLDATADEIVERVRLALATDDNKARVRNAIGAYFDFVAETAAYRLVFESDLRNEPAVRQRVQRAERVCMNAVADTIAVDAQLPREYAELLSMGLLGLSEVSARYWLSTKTDIDRDQAVAMLSHLAWRGISGYPRQP